MRLQPRFPGSLTFVVPGLNQGERRTYRLRRARSDDKDLTAKFTLTVSSTAGAVAASRWTASALAGTLTYDSPATACQRALLVWTVNGTR